MNLDKKIEKHLGRSINFETEIILFDDGEGQYVKEWNVAEPEPKLEDLEKIDVTVEVALVEVRMNRRHEYPKLAEQLDMLFHDMTAGKGTKDGGWYKAVAKVKSDNPKPE